MIEWLNDDGDFILYYIHIHIHVHVHIYILVLKHALTYIYICMYINSNGINNYTF